MNQQYSRLQKVQEQQSKKTAFIFGGLTIAILAFLLIFGLPLIARFASFISNLKSGNQVAERQTVPPPPPPIFSNIPEFTNQDKIDITGSSQPDTIIKLYFDDNLKEVSSDSDGVFKTTLTLRKGQNTLYGKAKYKNSDESAQSKIYEIVLDKDAPKIELKNPQDGANLVKQRVITIEGTTDPGTTVTVNDRLAIVSSDGNFKLSYQLSDGENVLNIKAQDQAGNKLEQEIKVNFTP